MARAYGGWFLYDDQKYWFAELRETQWKGKPYTVQVWRSNCADCGQEFEHNFQLRFPLGVQGLNRRCDACKKPGQRVGAAGDREAPVPRTPSSAHARSALSAPSAPSAPPVPPVPKSPALSLRARMFAEEIGRRLQETGEIGYSGSPAVFVSLLHGWAPFDMLHREKDGAERVASTAQECLDGLVRAGLAAQDQSGTYYIIAPVRLPPEAVPSKPAS